MLFRSLPNDEDISLPPTQRHFNPEWYDQTYLSMVIETMGNFSVATPTFITEKSFKPIAFQHPFIIYGDKNTLKLLREWGFETYDNLWDESYDQLSNLVDRRDAIIKILQSVEVKNYDSETLRRIEHNYRRFFDQELVTRRIIEKVIEPILEYAET